VIGLRFGWLVLVLDDCFNYWMFVLVFYDLSQSLMID